MKEKIQADQKLWSEGKTPNGNRPFKVSFENQQLEDKPEGSVKLELDLDHNLSYRQNIAKLHYFYISEMKKMEITVMEKRIALLAEHTKFETFRTRIDKEVVKKSQEDLAKVHKDASKKMFEMNAKLLEQTELKLYQGMIIRARETIRKKTRKGR